VCNEQTGDGDDDDDRIGKQTKDDMEKCMVKKRMMDGILYTIL